MDPRPLERPAIDPVACVCSRRGPSHGAAVLRKPRSAWDDDARRRWRLAPPAIPASAGFRCDFSHTYIGTVRICSASFCCKCHAYARVPQLCSTCKSRPAGAGQLAHLRRHGLEAATAAQAAQLAEAGFPPRSCGHVERERGSTREGALSLEDETSLRGGRPEQVEASKAHRLIVQTHQVDGLYEDCSARPSSGELASHPLDGVNCTPSRCIAACNAACALPCSA